MVAQQVDIERKKPAFMQAPMDRFTIDLLEIVEVRTGQRERTFVALKPFARHRLDV
jgi:hypothetical protein